MLVAAQNIPYDTHMQDLGVSTGITQGKLDQKSRCVVVKMPSDVTRTTKTLAEKEEVNERTWKKKIRNKMAARAAERGKSFASVRGSFRQGDDFSQYPNSCNAARFVWMLALTEG
ncbi:hypothetical protein PsorP6_018772 [Peronosclerospora sorghi]|nr:hypothetical protein PsorP6_018772 [Peronosclerospora sorghi]